MFHNIFFPFFLLKTQADIPSIDTHNDVYSMISMLWNATSESWVKDKRETTTKESKYIKDRNWSVIQTFGFQIHGFNCYSS